MQDKKLSNKKTRQNLIKTQFTRKTTFKESLPSKPKRQKKQKTQLASSSSGVGVPSSVASIGCGDPYSPSPATFKISSGRRFYLSTWSSELSRGNVHSMQYYAHVSSLLRSPLLPSNYPASLSLCLSELRVECRGFLPKELRETAVVCWKVGIDIEEENNRIAALETVKDNTLQHTCTIHYQTLYNNGIGDECRAPLTEVLDEILAFLGKWEWAS